MGPNIQSLLRQFQSALNDEITAVREGGGRRSYLTDGRCLGLRDGYHIYSFSSDAELHFPDDTSVDLEYQGRKQTGYIQSLDGFDVILALPEHIGDAPGMAILHTAPWFLLDELRSRLRELGRRSEPLRHLVEELLARSSESRAADGERAYELLKGLGTVTQINAEQLDSVGHLLTNGVSFIWGPPGTGKTTALGLAVAALVQAEQSVLVMAHSNVAVDVAIVSAARLLQDRPTYLEGQMLRYGVSYLPSIDDFPKLTARGVLKETHPHLLEQVESLERDRHKLVGCARTEGLDLVERGELKDQLADVKAALDAGRARLKDEEDKLVFSAKVLACTLCKAALSSAVYQRCFDAVLIDEASMATIPQCAFASGLARQHVGIYGDFRQLAPIAQGNTPAISRWLKRDIYDYAGLIRATDTGQSDPRMVMLTTQYRMHPQISRVPNRLFYGGHLVDAADVEKRTRPILRRLPQMGEALANYDLAALETTCFREKQSYSRFNLESALVAVHLAYQALQHGQQTIGIVTPYNAQSRLIHRLLRDLGLPQERVRVATVHRFQGSERDVMIFDTVDTNPMKPGLPLKGDHGSTAMRLTNVAISRARGKFVMLADQDYIRSRFASRDSLRRLIAEIEQGAPTIALSWSSGGSTELFQPNLPGLTFYSDPRDAKEELESDLLSARGEIAISWPNSPVSFSPDVLTRLDSSRVRYFVTGAGSDQFHIGLQNAMIWHSYSRSSLGLVGIDRKAIWMYPDPRDRNQPALRLGFPKTAELLYAFLELVPEKEARQETVEQRLEQGKSPVGRPCPRCGGLLWPRKSKYGDGVRLACLSSGCDYTKPMTVQDATSWARINKIICLQCGGQARGRKGPTGLFLGCSNYPRCRWTMPIEKTI